MASLCGPVLKVDLFCRLTPLEYLAEAFFSLGLRLLWILGYCWQTQVRNCRRFQCSWRRDAWWRSLCERSDLSRQQSLCGERLLMPSVRLSSTCQAMSGILPFVSIFRSQSVMTAQAKQHGFLSVFSYLTSGSGRNVDVVESCFITYSTSTSGNCDCIRKLGSRRITL